MIRPLSPWHWLVPLFLLVAGTAIVWILDLDHAVARAYFSPGDPTHWPVGYEQPWAFLYRWAVTPAIGLAAGGCVALAGSFRAPRRALSRAGALIVLSLALGPLLLVNGILHETWGRPRPRQVVEFGGTKTYRPVLLPVRDRQAQSFPTGHAAGGFSLFAAYFALRGARPRLAWFFLLGGLALGGIIAWARIAQGGHWLSDCLWSAGIVWFAACTVAWAMERREAARSRASGSAAFRPRPWAAWSCLAAAAALCMGYSAFLPVQERVIRELGIPADTRKLHVAVAGPPVVFHTLASAERPARMIATLSGRGVPWSALDGHWRPDANEDGAVRGTLSLEVSGYSHRQNLELWVEAPPGVDVTVERSAPR